MKFFKGCEDFHIETHAVRLTNHHAARRPVNANIKEDWSGLGYT